MSSFHAKTPTKSAKPSPSKKSSPVQVRIPVSEDAVRRSLYLQLLLLQDSLCDSMQQQEAAMQHDLLKAWQVVYDIENQAAAMENEAMRVSTIAQLDKSLNRTVQSISSDDTGDVTNATNVAMTSVLDKIANIRHMVQTMEHRILSAHEDLTSHRRFR